LQSAIKSGERGRREIVLSSSPPDSMPQRSTSKTNPTRKRKTRVESSDEEVEETIEERQDPEYTTKASGGVEKQRYSPDPLALVDKSPIKLMTSSSAVASGSKAEASGSTSAVASGSKNKAAPKSNTATSRRSSSRVEIAKAKEEKEKEERREKRRKEKEETAKRESEGGVSSLRDPTRDKSARRGTSEVEDPRKGRIDPDEGEEEEEGDVIVLEDTPATANMSKKVEKGVLSTVEKSAGKKRKVDNEEEAVELDALESLNGSGEDDFVPEKKGRKEKAKPAPKGKGGKGKNGGKKGKVAKGKSSMDEPKGEEKDIVMGSLEAAVILPQNETINVDAVSKGSESEKTAVEEMEVEVEEVCSCTWLQQLLLISKQEITKVLSPVEISPLKVSTTKINAITPIPAVIHRPSPGPMKPDGSASKPGGIKWKTSQFTATTI